MTSRPRGVPRYGAKTIYPKKGGTMIVNKTFETAIIGSGVVGSGLLFTLARYTDIRDIVLFEKYDEPSRNDRDRQRRPSALRLPGQTL